MLFALALLPIALILFLMVGLRWGAARAGGAGYLSALVIATLFFGAGLELLAYAHVKALLLSVDVLLIIWAAFLLYRIADEAGAIRTIGQALPHLTNDAGMQALIIGWVFATFLQGVGGFGVPVAVIAPLLVSLGFSPLAAIIIPSVGHGWAVTFGSLGSSFQALIAATGLPAELIAPPTALFVGIAGLCSGWLVVHAAQGWQAMKRLSIPVLLLGVVMGGVAYLVAVSGLWNIASFMAGMAGLVLCFPLAKRFQGEKRENGKLDVRGLMVALSGYVILITVILIVQLIPQVKLFLNQVVLQVRFPEVSTSLGFVTPAGVGRKISLFGHIGIVLLYSSILAYFVYWRAGLYKAGALRKILSGTFWRVLSSSVSILSMVTMSVIMENAGMTEALAKGLAESLGGIYPMVAPWIGALGAFMTGNNTNSNVVFGGLQMQTAIRLGYPVAIILAAQTAGASLGSVLAPTKIAMGASTAGMAGREGDVMRKLIVYTGILVLLVSLLTAVAVRMM